MRYALGLRAVARPIWGSRQRAAYESPSPVRADERQATDEGVRARRGAAPAAYRIAAKICARELCIHTIDMLLQHAPNSTLLTVLLPKSFADASEGNVLWLGGTQVIAP